MAKLSEKQIAAIEYLALPKLGGKTYEQIAEEVGVSDRTLRNWRNDEAFAKELGRKIIRNTQERLPEVMESVPDHIIKDGNAAMLRTLLQAHGLLTEKHEVSSTSNSGTSSDIDEMKAQLAEFRGSKTHE